MFHEISIEFAGLSKPASPLQQMEGWSRARPFLWLFNLSMDLRCLRSPIPFRICIEDQWDLAASPKRTENAKAVAPKVS